MPHQAIHGYPWLVFPDTFGRDETEVHAPGHPFGARPGEAAAPVEVLYYRPVHAADTGVCNERHEPTYLVVTRTQHHPRLNDGWDSEPAILTEKFTTEDGKVRMIRIVQQHQKRSGNLLECELKVEEH